jgi:hypothetical protein
MLLLLISYVNKNELSGCFFSQKCGIMQFTNFQGRDSALRRPVAERSVRRRKNGAITTFVPSCRTGTPQRGIPTA